MTGKGTGRPEGVDRRLARLFVIAMSISLTVASFVVLVAHRFGAVLIERLRRRRSEP
ncbi:hypothetical protein [Natronorubrum sp. DTA28]|uniref:hypothetical protein n=1 Tax=Natronorubrum sp. DTA28 TaxID=3447019 RepID=UPI003F85C7F1